MKKDQMDKTLLITAEEDYDSTFYMPWVEKTFKISKILSLALILLSILILLGWILDISFLKGLLLGSVSTRFNTAIIFLILGVSSYLINARQRNIKNFLNTKKNTNTLIMIIAFIISIYGLISFLEYLFGFSLPTDTILSFNIARPRILSSINIFLFGIILILFIKRIRIREGQVLCIITGLIAYMGLLTFLTGSGLGQTPYNYTQMAFFSALLNILASLSFISIYPKEGIMKVFHQRTTGGLMARTLIPSSIFSISIVGMLVVIFEESAIIPQQFGEVLLLTIITGFLIFLIWRFSFKMNKIDISRRKADKKIINVKRFFEEAMEGLVYGIMVTDSQNQIQYINKGMENLFKIDCNKLVGKNFFKDSNYISQIINIENHYLKAYNTLKTEFIPSIEISRGKKTLFISGWIIPKIKNGKFNGVILTASDITANKEAENILEASLKEKDILMAEIHHRVKNNMQIISSLLRIQSTFIEDEAAREVLLDSQNRIKTMAAVHESLYRSENFSQINMSNYISNLIKDLQSTYQQGNKINFSVDSSPINLEIEMAIPVGLIINELVTNSIKHAFPNDREGNISINFQKISSEYILVIEDDGIGIPDNSIMENSHSMGMELVNALINQLDGKLKVKNLNGTIITIKFAKVHYSSRFN
jgi:PAS domain S-box-containing protein